MRNNVCNIYIYIYIYIYVDYRYACSHCVRLSISKECICCQDIMKMNEKMEEAEIPELLGITGHPGLHAVCLNVLTLQTAYYQY